MKKFLCIAGIVIAVLLGGLAVYETIQVFRARAQTPELIATALRGADPEIFQLPSRRIAMLLAVEDPSFWTNDGTDYSSKGAGNTTLTQSLGKRIYFPRGFHPGFQKIKLVLTAKFALTPLISKQEILQAFLTKAWLGRDETGPVFGFAQGAHRFYRKELSQLSDDQFLSLVAALYSPAAMNPLRHPQANAERVGRIQRLLAHRCTPAGLHDVALEGCAI